MIDSVVLQSERIASDFLQERVQVSYQIRDKGIVNQVCVVETETNKVVVRLNSSDYYWSFYIVILTLSGDTSGAAAEERAVPVAL